MQTTANTPAVGDDDLAADVDEPPEPQKEITQSDFHKAAIHFEAPRKESLLTKALKSPDMINSNQDAPIRVNTDLTRRRSMMSNASLASTAELTSDGGLTSPARTNTPSPPPPSDAYTNFGPYSLGTVHSPIGPAAPVEIKDSISHLSDVLSISPRAQPPAEVVPKKRCITFACGGSTRPAKVVQPTPIAPQSPAALPATEAPKRRCTIKFACPAPRDLEKDTAKQLEVPKPVEAPTRVEASKRTSRSPSMTRKSPRPTSSGRTQHRESTGTIRRASQSPAAVRAKPKYMTADEKTLRSSEATRFHEFASEVIQEDEWILKESVPHLGKMTINDTLKKENAIRLLGSQAEEEALEEEDEEDEDDGNDSDIESGEEDEDEDDDRSDFGGSDGNESDNEAGFADSDDGSEDGGDLAFWTPGRSITIGRNIEASTYRASAHRTASASSIDSLAAMRPVREEARARRKPKPIKIRPGTPDLPDSTDFVCGTLDEDRPLEEAYVSCMKMREHARHKQTPQDIDPSFPTSDIEDEEDENDDFPAAIGSEDPAWHQGKFEVDDDERLSRRRVTGGRRKSPAISPKPRLHSPPPPRRMHSPPPAKTRLRSPPPRKLFGGHSPKRMRSPPPARAINSPPGSPTLHSTSAAIAFAPLGSRPGLTHTKSLPRTPNAFCRAYNASRLIAANGNNDDDNNDSHVRGAIDIVKGLEQKRQRRKEKFYQKHCNRKAKGHLPERRPQPGKGAERMRELGLLMAGKKGGDDPYMMSA